MLHIAKILRASHLSRGFARPLFVAIGSIEWMGRVATQRRALRELDDRQLKDIGLSRADALREANRPFWDVPIRSDIERGGNDGRMPLFRRGKGVGSHLPPAAFSRG